MDQSVYDTNLKPGDPYVAKRNASWELLICEEVVYGANRCNSSNEKYFCKHHPEKGHPDYIIPTEENAYCYDSWESFKVLSLD